MDEDQKQLNEQERMELREGQVLYEWTKSPAFEVVKGWLDALAFHSWVDPRETTSEEEWKWQELNAFHAANVAKELMDKVQASISRSDFLDKKQKGEISVNKMRI